MPYRLYRSILFPLLMLCCGLPLTAQAPSTDVPQMANAVKICPEGCSITSISPAAVVQIGTNTAPGGWGPTFSIPNSALPLLVSYVVPFSAALPPADPLPGVAKEIDAQMMASPYTVAWVDAAGAAHTTPVAALPAPAPTPAPTASTTLATLLQLLLPPPSPGLAYALVFTCIPQTTPAAPQPGLPTYGIQLPCAVSIDLVGIGPNYQPLPAATAAPASK